MHIMTFDNVKPGVDVIGDTHGYYDEFRALLLALGYRKNKGAYKHPSGERTVQFLGDKLDRGNKIVELHDEQRRMIDAGSAKDLMGNHEYNLRCMYLPAIPNEGRPLRPRNPSNLDQTKQTRMQFRALKDGGRALNYMLGQVYMTPIYADCGEFRIAHACWDPVNIAVLDKELTRGLLAPDHMIHAEMNFKKTPLSTAIVETLKGKEIKTKALLDYGFTEDELRGEKSTKRVAWWYENRGDMDVPAGDVILDLPKHMRDRPIPLNAVADYLVDDPDPRPVFFGHYCLKQPPRLTGSKYQCVDFGVIKSKGCLTAYQWNTGDSGLDESRLVSVPRKTPKPA